MNIKNKSLALLFGAVVMFVSSAFSHQIKIDVTYDGQQYSCVVPVDQENATIFVNQDGIEVSCIALTVTDEEAAVAVELIDNNKNTRTNPRFIVTKSTPCTLENSKECEGLVVTAEYVE